MGVSITDPEKDSARYDFKLTSGDALRGAEADGGDKAVSCPLTPDLVMIHAEMRGELVYHLPRRFKLLEVDGSSVVSWIFST